MPTRILTARRGAALLEVTIASACLVTVLAGIAPLVASTTLAVRSARHAALAAVLAQGRLAELQAITFFRGLDGTLVADVTTTLDGGAFASGGSGLSITGAAPLTTATPPQVDWLDEQGVWLASSAEPPAAARFRRRWAVVSAGVDGCVRLWVDVDALQAAAVSHQVHVGALRCAWRAR